MRPGSTAGRRWCVADARDDEDDADDASEADEPCDWPDQPLALEWLGSAPVQLVAGRATYWNAGGVRWAAGTNALATRLR